MTPAVAILLNHLLARGYQHPTARNNLTFRYTNHLGITDTRSVQPVRVWFGVTPYHIEPAWLLHAWDVDRQAWRDFDLERMEMEGVTG